MRNKIVNYIFRFGKYVGNVKIILRCKRRIIRNFLCLILLSVVFCGHSAAGVWRDSFDDEELKDWKTTLVGGAWGTSWEVAEGFLFGKLGGLRGQPRCDETAGGFIRWNAHNIRLKELTVIGRKIIYPQKGPYGFGELCLFMGKLVDIDDFEVKGYIFSPEETSKVSFSIGSYSRGSTRAWYGDKFPLTSEHLEAVFDSGKFQLFTKDVLLTEFVDNDFTEIDVVGLLVTCHVGGHWFGGGISSFSVSGLGIPDHNLSVELRETHLATTWAQIKRFE